MLSNAKIPEATAAIVLEIRHVGRAGIDPFGQLLSDLNMYQINAIMLSAHHLPLTKPVVFSEVRMGWPVLVVAILLIVVWLSARQGG